MFTKIDLPDEIENIYIDVGLSFSAPYSINWLETDPKSFVFGFEPIPENCERALKKIKTLEFQDRFKLYQYAVDNVESPQLKDFYVTCNSEIENDYGQSSLFKLKDELKYGDGYKGCRMWVEKVIPTLCVNLTDFLDTIDWNRFKVITCLKTDTQGNDLNILKSIENFFDRIPLIHCEAYANGQYQKEDDSVQIVYDYMISNGYKLIDGWDSSDHVYRRI